MKTFIIYVQLHLFCRDAEKERFRAGWMQERKIQEWRDAERGKAEQEE